MLDATIITADDTERDEAGETELDRLNKGRHRIFERTSQPMNVESLLQQHDRCSLVICNTVQRAMEIYLHLSQAIARQGRPVILRLLHSLFSDEDRKEQGKELAQLLGKEQWRDGLYQGEQSLIVVATKVVEVGLDISVQIIHSELAPANSLVQRAGRCARFARQQGRVIVYPLPLDDEGRPVSSLPYQASLCEATWQALEPFSGQVVGFREEQQLIDSVHTASDLDLLKRYEDRCDEIQWDITSCLRTSDRKQVTDLIRDIDQIQVVIHNDPNSELKIKPWRWQSFGLRPNTLMSKHWERLRACQAELDLSWLCMQCVPGGSKKEQNQQLETVLQQDDELQEV